MTVRVRIAPSPTGHLHIGNIKAAVVNWLFARHHGGNFMLRIDDTDQERSKAEYEEGIKTDLTWLGLTWDTFGRESDRFDTYYDMVEKLKANGRLYPCFETSEELDLKRKSQLARSLPPLYDRGALKLTPEEVATKVAAGEKPHWRFKLEHKPVKWDDLIQGTKEFNGADLSDPVVVREDGVPLFTFCGIIDDLMDETTHVIRGEDHVSNTAIQLQIGEAVAGLLGQPLHMKFGHFPRFVAADGGKMSKRLGTLSIRELREDMHLEPMAIISVVATLGTALPTEAYKSLDELAKQFDIGVISHAANARFDIEEVRRINAKMMHDLPFSAAKDRLATLGLGDVSEEFWNGVRSVLTTVADVKEWWDIAHAQLTPTIEDATFANDAAAVLPAEPWTQETFSQWVNAVKEKTGKKGKQLFMPLRLALTGREHGPEMNVLLPLIGRTRAEARLRGKAA